jgi:hypothetical protein
MEELIGQVIDGYIGRAADRRGRMGRIYKA